MNQLPAIAPAPSFGRLVDRGRIVADGRRPPSARSRSERSAFQVDQDRIIFSRPFRRLQAKTQVHPLPTNDHIRNRLIHTLEVASVGRSLGTRFGQAIPGTLGELGMEAAELGHLVQAACFAHDIGNPTFGHTGEAAISAWLQKNLRGLLHDEGLGQALDGDSLDDLEKFEGNAQGFRILTKLDNNRYRGGLQLTAATLASFVKYPWTSADPRVREGKFGFYLTEADIAARVFSATGLAGADGRLRRHPFAWLTEAADDICYTIADFEDAEEMDIVAMREFEWFMRQFLGESQARYEALTSDLERVGYLRGNAIGTLIDDAALLFAKEAPALVDGSIDPPPLLDRLAASDAHYAAALKGIQQFNRKHVYSDRRKVEVEIAAYDMLGGLLGHFVPATIRQWQARQKLIALSYKDSQVLGLIGEYAPAEGTSLAEHIRCGIDFVGGMTDRYALLLFRRLKGITF
ncbi:MAG: dNTP triphosphohydrolase [Acetobacteraceae bacterium]|nr:dNTP triphosphohydrolase [Acetobacteraceae bacterium]